MAENILEVHDLEIRYVTDEETVQAVNDITFSLERGESIGLVGETGAGKTTTALGIMGLVPDPPGLIPLRSLLADPAPRPLESWGWCRIRQERS